jgi:hypothetical protein
MKKVTKEKKEVYNRTYFEKNKHRIRKKRLKDNPEKSNHSDVKEAIDKNNKNGLLFYKSFFWKETN